MLVRVGPSLCRDCLGPSVVIRVGAVLIPCCSRVCPCLAGFVRVAAVLPLVSRSLDDRRRSITPKSARIIPDLVPAGSGTFGTAVLIRAYMGLGLNKKPNDVTLAVVTKIQK